MGEVRRRAGSQHDERPEYCPRQASKGLRACADRAQPLLDHRVIIHVYTLSTTGLSARRCSAAPARQRNSGSQMQNHSSRGLTQGPTPSVNSATAKHSRVRRSRPSTLLSGPPGPEHRPALQQQPAGRPGRPDRATRRYADRGCGHAGQQGQPSAGTQSIRANRNQYEPGVRLNLQQCLGKQDGGRSRPRCSRMPGHPT